MPNKWKVEFIITDNFEDLKEEPMAEKEIREEVVPFDLQAGLVMSNMKVEKLEGETNG